MKIVKLFLLLITITGVFSNYQDLLQTNENTQVTNVYYNHRQGNGPHSNVYITLENVRGSIKYHRHENGKEARYDENRDITTDDNTTRYDPIQNLTLIQADGFYHQMDGGYQAPSRVINRIIVRNCYSFADGMINRLTGQNVNYTQQYLIHNQNMQEDEIGVVNINATKRIQKKLRRKNQKKLSRKIEYTKNDNISKI